MEREKKKRDREKERVPLLSANWVHFHLSAGKIFQNRMSHIARINGMRETNRKRDACYMLS